MSVSPDGLAGISVVLDRMETATSVMGIRVLVGLGAGGKLETRTIRRPESPPSTPSTRPIPLFEMKLDPTGQVSMVNPESPDTMTRLLAGENVAVMLNACVPGIGMLMLPERPVKTGDAWEWWQEVHISLAPPALAGDETDDPGSGASLNLRATFHSSLLRAENGHAVIETQVTVKTLPGASTAIPGGAAAPSGAAVTTEPRGQATACACANGEIIPLGSVGIIEKMDQSMSSTVLFNIAQGVIEGGNSEIYVAVAPAMGPPLQASLDGTVMARVERLTAPPATGAP